MHSRAAMEEYVRRSRARAGVRTLTQRILSELFGNQTDFVTDPSRNKAALCTRRAGKTSMWARYCTAEALLHERVLIRIWGVSRLRVKQLLWDEFQYLFARHEIQVRIHETELTMRFPNGSEIRLLGADKDKEVQKKRGDKTWMEVVVESQLFGPYLRNLVEEVAEPCLFDLKGTFCLEGTPGPICAGYWFDVSGREDAAKRWSSVGTNLGVGAGWSVHRWSVLDNPFLPHAAAELAALKAKRRWADDNPTYIREWLGRWVNDIGALFYKFDEVRNTFSQEVVKPWGPGWRHVLGWDLGSRDDMALVAWGWHNDYPNLYEAYSWKQPGALAQEVIEHIDALERRGFNFIEKVADTGGGGRMYVEEVMSRYSHVFKAAKKTEKAEHVRLMNDEFLTGHLLVQRGSSYASELATLPKDPDWPDPDKPDAPPTEDPRFPNHCCDAGLYSWRAAQYYFREERAPRPAPGTKEFTDALEAKLEASISPRKTPWWEPQDGLLQLEDFD